MLTRQPDVQLSRNFRLREFAVSDTFPMLAEMPRGHAVQTIRRGVVGILQPLRDVIGVPIKITSGYRSAALNAAIGGSDTSDHARGAAADILAPPYTDEELIEVVYRLHRTGQILGLDQAITYEHTGHLHLGWGERARGQFLVAHPDGTYSTWRAA